MLWDLPGSSPQGKEQFEEIERGLDYGDGLTSAGRIQETENPFLMELEKNFGIKRAEQKEEGKWKEQRAMGDQELAAEIKRQRKEIIGASAYDNIGSQTMIEEIEEEIRKVRDFKDHTTDEQFTSDRSISRFLTKKSGSQSASPKKAEAENPNFFFEEPAKRTIQESEDFLFEMEWPHLADNDLQGLYPQVQSQTKEKLESCFPAQGGIREEKKEAEKNAEKYRKKEKNGPSRSPKKRKIKEKEPTRAKSQEEGDGPLEASRSNNQNPRKRSLNQNENTKKTGKSAHFFEEPSCIPQLNGLNYNIPAYSDIMKMAQGLFPQFSRESQVREKVPQKNKEQCDSGSFDVNGFIAMSPRNESNHEEESLSKRGSRSGTESSTMSPEKLDYVVELEKKEFRKRQRRQANQIERAFACPIPTCRKSYGYPIL